MLECDGMGWTMYFILRRLLHGACLVRRHPWVLGTRDTSLYDIFWEASDSGAIIRCGGHRRDASVGSSNIVNIQVNYV